MKALSEKSTTSRKRKLILISSIVGGLVIGGAVYAFFAIKQQQQANEDRQRDASTIKEEQVKTNNESTGQSQLPSKTDTQNQAPQPPADTPSAPLEKPVLERASGDPTLKVVATFQKASSGTCELQLSAPGQQTKTYTSNIVVSSSYYTCSFSIPRSNLPAGSWSAVVVHRVGSASTSSDSRSIDL